MILNCGLAALGVRLMHIRLSAVLQLFDGYRRRPIRAPEASFLVGRNPIRPIYKQNGYFVFPNLQPGPVRIDILSPLFLPEIVELDVPEEAGQYSVIYRVLSPGRAYPFGGAPTALRGRLIKDGVPAALEKVLFYVLEGRELLKVAQDDLKAGDKEIKLFSSQQTRRLPLPGKFLIADKDEKRKETCFITGTHTDGNIYPLEQGLTYPHARATPLIELIEFHTAADGSFFIAVPERYDSVRQAELEAPSAGKTWSVAIVHGKETDIGELRVEN